MSRAPRWTLWAVVAMSMVGATPFRAAAQMTDPTLPILQTVSVPASTTIDPPGRPCAKPPCDSSSGALNDQTERHGNIVFVKYLLVDALWFPTQTGDHSVGIIGGHLALAQVGRMYIYGPPGVIMLLADTAHGRQLRPGYTWGFSIFVKEFSVPGSGRRAMLFVNLAKCWSQGDDRISSSMVGLSIGWKR